MFKRRDRSEESQQEFRVETRRLPNARASTFYRKLDETLEKIGLTDGVREICRPAYADASGGALTYNLAGVGTPKQWLAGVGRLFTAVRGQNRARFIPGTVIFVGPARLGNVLVAGRLKISKSARFHRGFNLALNSTYCY